MAHAAEVDLASPFISAQKSVDVNNALQPPTGSIQQAKDNRVFSGQSFHSPSEWEAAFCQPDNSFDAAGTTYRSPGKLWGMASRLWGNRSLAGNSSVVDGKPCPVRVMPLSSGWFESGSYSFADQTAPDVFDQDREGAKEHQVVLEKLWDEREQGWRPQNPLKNPGLQQQQPSRGFGRKQGSKLHRLLSGWGTSTLSLKHSRQFPNNVSPTDSKPPTHQSRCAPPHHAGGPADAGRQYPVQQQQTSSCSPAASDCTSVSFRGQTPPEQTVGWWPYEPQQASAFGATSGAAAAAAAAAAESASVSSGYGGSPARSSISLSPSRFDGSSAASAPSRCGMLLEELPSLCEVTEDFSDTTPSAVAGAAVAAKPVAAGPQVCSAAAMRSISFDTVGRDRDKKRQRGYHSRRCSSAIAAATGRRPRNSLDRTNSLRAALVALDHASAHAGRFLDKMSQGLARVTSVSVRSGIMKQPAGKEVLKDWEFGPELGRGATCVTRLAFSRRNGCTAACKCIHKSSIFRSAAVKAALLGVQRELAIMQHTSGHPNVVQLRGVYEDRSHLHIVMEWCGGGALSQLAARVPGGRCGEAAAAAVGKAVLEVLVLCHGRGVIHRDIKLDNLLLSQPVDDPQKITADMVKVTDFGISVPYTPGQMLSELAGTPEYMAPEVLQRRYCQQADIWSTGVVLYELLSGSMPYTGHTAEQLLRSIHQTELHLTGPGWEGVSDDAKSIVAMMLTQDPNSRPSAQQLLTTFHEWLQLGVAQ